MANEQLNILYTIGHSNHTIDDFVSLLKRHEITCVVDVRSTPYSQYCYQFNRESLAPALQSNNIEYVYLGDQLGARPSDTHCYDGDNINFEYLARTEQFILGLSRLIDVASKYRVALMCAEKDPIECHRFILICKHLKGYNFHIRHILADGTTECHGDAERRLVKTLKVEPTIFVTVHGFASPQQRWDGFLSEVGVEGVAQKREDAAILLATGRNHRPEPFRPTLTP